LAMLAVLADSFVSTRPGRSGRLIRLGGAPAGQPARTSAGAAPDQVTEFDDPVKRGVSPYAFLYLITAGPGGCARSWPRGALNAGWPGPVVNARTPPGQAGWRAHARTRPSRSNGGGGLDSPG